MEGLKVKHAKEWNTVPNHDVTICSGELDKLRKDRAELLEACRELLKYINTDNETKAIMYPQSVQFAEDAIAKAEQRQ